MRDRVSELITLLGHVVSELVLFFICFNQRLQPCNLVTLDVIFEYCIIKYILHYGVLQ